MITTIFKIRVFILLFILMGAGCKKEDEYEDIPLENIKCPCEHDVSYIKQIVVENVVLFDSAKTSWDEMKTQTFDGEKSEFVSYSEELKSMAFYSVRTTMTGISYVCNIPDKISNWSIPSTGIVITLNANEYESCIPKPNIANNTYSNCVLITLKRRIK